MDVNLWGKLYFEPQLDKVEGDFTFGGVKIRIESFLVDSFNMYDTSL